MNPLDNEYESLDNLLSVQKVKFNSHEKCLKYNTQVPFIIQLLLQIIDMKLSVLLVFIALNVFCFLAEGSQSDEKKVRIQRHS